MHYRRASHYAEVLPLDVCRARRCGMGEHRATEARSFAVEMIRHAHHGDRDHAAVLRTRRRQSRPATRPPEPCPEEDAGCQMASQERPESGHWYPMQKGRRSALMTNPDPSAKGRHPTIESPGPVLLVFYLVHERSHLKQKLSSARTAAVLAMFQVFSPMGPEPAGKVPNLHGISR